MTQGELRLQRLSADHDPSDFDSGSPSLDSWLQRHALAAQRMDSARTFLLVDTRVLGYFSLTMASVHRSEPPAQLVRGMPGYPVGAVLLARLAVDRREQGRGLGALLLTEALRKAVAAGAAAAARLIIVDGINDAASAFYRHHGFLPAPEHPVRLYRAMKDVRASL